MAKVGKWIGIVVGALVGLVTVALAALLGATPYAPAPTAMQVEATPERLARGAYLAEHVMVCVDCHSQRDFSQFAGPAIEGTVGAGGQHWGRADGLPGDVWSANITPAGVGEWTDGELARAITVGVDRDGDTLVPMMPYGNYHHLCEEDLASIVTWVRHLEPIENEVPEAQVDFPVSLLLRTLPAAYEPESCPDARTSSEERGRYLVGIAGCADCHTRREGADFVGPPLAGGNEFPMPGGTARSMNLTPDDETGTGLWTEEAFIARFARQRGESFPVAEGELNSPMPWGMYAGMSDDDLRAIFAYLRTIEPVRSPIERWTPAEQHLASVR